MSDIRNKIAWVTPTAFLDTDLPIVERLQKRFNILMIVYVPFYQKGFDENFVISRLSGCDVEFVYGKNKFSWLNPLHVLRIIRKAKKHNPDLYYMAYQAMPYGSSFYKWLIGLNKIVVPCHNVSTPKGAHWEPLARKYTHSWLSTFKNIQVFSKSQYDLLNSLYRGKNVNQTRFLLKDYGEPTNTDSYDTDKKVKFLIFGNVSRYKRIDLLIEAANIVYDKGYKNFSVRIGGYCKNWEPYQNLIRHQEVFDLRIKRIPNEDIPNLFGDCHYFVQPYQDIAQSGSMFVAFRYGLPSIVSDIDQFKEFVTDGYNGLMFKSGDATALAEVMIKVIREHKDIYPRLKNNQLVFVEKNFSEKQIVDSYTEYFKSIIQNNEATK